MKRWITYYQKEYLIKVFSIILMLVLLLINLFPIAWMVFCSFKNNTDILSGNVGFSRVGTNIYRIDAVKNIITTYSSDGSITQVNTTAKKILNRITIKGQNSNIDEDKDYYYLSQSNTGIFKITKKKFKVVTHTPNPVKGFDTNKFGMTSIAVGDHTLYYAVELRGLNKVYVYNKENLNLKQVIDLPLSSYGFVKTIKIIDNTLFIGTSEQVFEYALDTYQLRNSISLGEEYYPSGIQKFIKITKDKIILQLQTSVCWLDRQKKTISMTKSFGITRFENSELIGENLYVASAEGLTVIDLKKNKIVRKISGLIKELKDTVLVNPKSDYSIDEITCFALSNNNYIFGSSYGRISFLRQNEHKPFDNYQLPPGYRLIKWQNYSDLWKNIDFGLYLKNSVIISGFTMIFAMILATLTSYALVRYNFRGNKEFGIAILSTQMIPQIMYLIPLFIMFKWVTDVTGVQIKGTYSGLIFIYTAFFVPFSVWILRSFFASIPIDLEESARIDGCNGFQVFYKITLPLAIPGIIATGIYIFLTAWDELMFAWVLTNGNTLTIPIGIRLFVGNFQNRYDLMMAAATVATLPVLILFFMLQKHIVKGLTAGAVKG